MKNIDRAERLVDSVSLSRGVVMSVAFPFARGVGQRHIAERVVHQHGKKQQDADDQARPVGVKAGVEDALVDDREGQRARGRCRSPSHIRR